MRYSKQRALLLDLLKAHHDHPTADILYHELRNIMPSVSLGTVYRNLNQLADCGQILRIGTKGSERYDVALHPHDHIQCTVCGGVFDCPPNLYTIDDNAVCDATGFQLTSCKLILKGVCPHCQKDSSDPAQAVSK